MDKKYFFDSFYFEICQNFVMFLIFNVRKREFIKLIENEVCFVELQGRLYVCLDMI